MSDLLDDFAGAGLHLPSPCLDCGQDTSPRDGPHEYYMVHDELWAVAGMAAVDGFLCIGCLERRLGRELDYRDFTAAPCNRWSHRRSDRLAARKNATAA